MSATAREKFEAAARPALLVRRSDLPVPPAHRARSFFGGLPKLPPELDWPRAEVKTHNSQETVALNFLAQIDLAELSRAEMNSPLPQTGTLYFFCSSVFEDGSPPCRILYHAGSADLFPGREPPPDLMLLGGDGLRVKWLDPATDLHCRVEFKYPICFVPYRDFEFYEDEVGGELLIESLCSALGPGEPKESDLLQYRMADGYAADEDWPFNWLLVTHMVRSLLARTAHDLQPSPYRPPVSDETRTTLQGFEAKANRWLERSGGFAPPERLDAAAKDAFRAWWTDVVMKYEKVTTYPTQLTGDVGAAINHNIRYLAAYHQQALADVPEKYVANLERQNHWKTPAAKDGKYRFFNMAIPQILGYGSSPQGAAEEHREDVLLLQLQGDAAFLEWHTNPGCMLHFWLSRDALATLDFSKAVATLECS